MLPLSQVSEAKFYPVFRSQFFSWSVDGPLISTLLVLGTSQKALGMLDHKGHFQGFSDVFYIERRFLFYFSEDNKRAIIIKKTGVEHTVWKLKILFGECVKNM